MEYRIETKTAPTMYFIGVTTNKSSIMGIFPRWMQSLGQPDVVMEGIDHALHDRREEYRRTVAQIKYDPLSLGALVTTHKIDILEAAGDMFDLLDNSVWMTGEISCISKREGRLVAHAKDPLTAGFSLDAVLGEGYFARTGGDILVFGAGGSGKAIALHLIRKESSGDRPKRFVIVNRSAPRLTGFHQMVEASRSDIVFEYVLNEDPRANDKLIAELSDGSIVSNATGMGKDRPGSPVTDHGLFPRGGVAWELNYRGELAFWHQAKAQEEERNLRVEDGWLYFLHGWTQHIAEVLHIEMDEASLKRLAGLAEGLRPRLTPVPRSGDGQAVPGR